MDVRRSTDGKASTMEVGIERMWQALEITARRIKG